MKSRILTSALLVPVVLALMSVVLQAGDEEPGKLPGYVNLDVLPIPEGAEDVLELGPEPDRLLYALGIAEGEMPSGFLDGVAASKIMCFTAPQGYRRAIEPEITALRERLHREGWQPLLHVQDVGSLQIADIKQAGRHVVGLLVVSLKSGNRVTFLNLVGELDRGPLLSLLLGLDKGDTERLLQRRGED